MDSGDVVGTSAWLAGGEWCGLELPHEIHEPALLAQGKGRAGVGDGGTDLQPVSHNAGILEQPFDVASVNAATVSGWKLAKAARNAGRLRRMVAQDSPAWKPPG